MNYFELIDRYLDNSLSPSDKMAFEKELLTNEDLKTDLHIQKKMRAYQQIESNVKNQVQQLKKPSKHIKYRWLWAAAASVLLLMGVFILQENNNQKNKQALASLTTPPRYSLDKGKPSDNQMDESISVLFNNRHFAAVIPILEQKVQNNSKDYQALLYLGISYCHNNQIDKGQTSFDRIINGDAINKDEAQYWKAICLLNHGNIPAAKQILSDLKQNAKGHISEMSKKLLQII